MEYLCTCARTHRASVSQERFDRLCASLVCGLGKGRRHGGKIGGGGGGPFEVGSFLATPIGIIIDRDNVKH